MQSQKDTEVYVKRGHKKHFERNIGIWKQKELTSDLLKGGIAEFKKNERRLKSKR